MNTLNETELLNINAGGVIGDTVDDIEKAYKKISKLMCIKTLTCLFKIIKRKI